MKNEEQILRPVGKGGAGIRIPQFKNVEIPSGVMLEVLIALIPAAVFGCVMFGIRAVFILFFVVAHEGYLTFINFFTIFGTTRS